MTTHTVTAGTMTGAAQAMTAKVEPAPTYPVDDPVNFVENLADERLKQTVALAVYNSTGSRIAYIGLGLVASVAASIRAESEDAMTLDEAILAVQAEKFGTEVISQMGLALEGRVQLLSSLLALKHKMEQLVQENWPEFRGRSVGEDLKRTTEAREVMAGNVQAIYDHFEGEISKEDIVAGLKFDNEQEAASNAKRFDAAMMILNLIEAAPSVELGVEQEQRLFQTIHSAIKRLEMDCLTNKARGFTNSIERLACASVCKASRKRVELLLKHPRFTKQRIEQGEDKAAGQFAKAETGLNKPYSETDPRKELLQQRAAAADEEPLDTTVEAPTPIRDMPEALM